MVLSPGAHSEVLVYDLYPNCEKNPWQTRIHKNADCHQNITTLNSSTKMSSKYVYRYQWYHDKNTAQDCIVVACQKIFTLEKISSKNTNLGLKLPCFGGMQRALIISSVQNFNCLLDNCSFLHSVPSATYFINP